jgi:hypothetical protein
VKGGSAPRECGIWWCHCGGGQSWGDAERGGQDERSAEDVEDDAEPRGLGGT